MKFLTTTDIAERYGMDYRTAARWCQRGLFPNLVRGPKTGTHAIYLIPESDLEGFRPPRRGRPVAGKPTRLTAAQRRSRKRKKARPKKT